MKNCKKIAHCLFVLLSISCTLSSFGQKRGMAYGHHSPEDLKALTPEISWWYNWSVEPESTVAGVFGNYGFEFVPMTWNGSFDEEKLKSYLTLHPEAKYLLAFNEPNFKDQANLTPSAAAALWPKLEAIAKTYSLKIVAPAVNYCGNCVQENGVTYTDPVKYLDDFFAACPNCKVDYIAVHCYMNNVSALQWYVGLFKKYGKPIWLTEFAGWESNGTIKTVNDQINFMIGAVDFLETDPAVFRYSWFIGRGSGIATYPFIDLLAGNGQLTILGEVYKQMPVHNTTNVFNLPARIEAEAYSRMSGILLEKTSDVSGFANVGYIDTGDWMEYQINVPKNDNYTLNFRFASIKDCSLEIDLDGNAVQNQNFSSTNGYQNWATVQSSIALSAGVHTLRFQALTNGFNLNWFEIGDVVTAVPALFRNNRNWSVFPNPGNGNFTIQSDDKIAKFKVYSLNGKLIYISPFSNQLNLGHLSCGIYLLSAVDEKDKTISTRKISIQ